METLIGLIALLVLYIASNYIAYRLGIDVGTSRTLSRHLAILKDARKYFLTACIATGTDRQDGYLRDAFKSLQGSGKTPTIDTEHYRESKNSSRDP